MRISLNRDSSVPLYLQIKNQIRELILSGALPPGYKLPPERKLAEMLEVNRSTILNAYRELKADALVDSHMGQGTTVIPNGITGGEDRSTQVEPLAWRQYYSETALRAREPLLRDLLELANRNDIISFAAGIGVPEIDPIEELAEIKTQLLKHSGKALFQYSATEGIQPLRESICRLMSARGVNSTPEEILVLAGSQQGLDLAARIFIDPGDVVVVEEPTFFSAIQIFRAAGARAVGVPIDHDGIRVDLLEPILERYKPKLIYTIPNYQNPSGVLMSLERRKQLLKAAYHYRVPLLEDDAYGEIRYQGKMIPSLKSLDREGYVIYLSTFSKVMLPGLRVGWMAAPKQVVRQFALLKQMADLHTSSYAQWMFDSIVRRGLYERQLERVVLENSKRLDRMLNALEKHARGYLEWNTPKGGLYLWCRISEEVPQSRLLAKASEYRVAFVPGEPFLCGIQSQNYIRLNFTFPQPDQIDEGVRRLVKVIRDAMDEVNKVNADSDLEIRPIV